MPIGAIIKGVEGVVGHVKPPAAAAGEAEGAATAATGGSKALDFLKSTGTTVGTSVIAGEIVKGTTSGAETSVGSGAVAGAADAYVPQESAGLIPPPGTAGATSNAF